MKKEQLVKKCQELGISLTGKETPKQLKKLLGDHDAKAKTQESEEVANAETPSEETNGEDAETEADPSEDAPEDSGVGVDEDESETSEDEESKEDEGEDFGTANLEDEKAQESEEGEGKIKVVGLKNFTARDGNEVRKGKVCCISVKEYERIVKDPRKLIERA